MTLLPKRFILTLLEAAGGERKKEKIDLMYSQTEEQPKELLTGGSLKNHPSVKMSNNLAHCPVISLLHLYQVTHHGEGRVYSIHTV